MQYEQIIQMLEALWQRADAELVLGCVGANKKARNGMIKPTREIAANKE